MGGIEGIDGLGHLWFMSVIAVCYAATPLLQRLRRYSNMALPLLLAAGLLEFFVVKVAEFLFSCLFIYALCYLYASAGRRVKYLAGGFTAALLAWSLLAVSWDDVMHGGLPSLLLHTAGGAGSVMLAVLLSRRFGFAWGWRALRLPDRYSYDVYITHHVFILGPFSLLSLFPSPWANVPLVLALAALSAVLLHHASAWINRVSGGASRPAGQ